MICCPNCQENKDESDFYVNKWRPNGLSYWCKPCNRERSSEYKLLDKYNITTEQYNAMADEQNNLCAICEQPERIKQAGKIKKLNVDHCHRTGIVRSLLCFNCNTLLGKLNDNTELCLKAANYLDKYNSDYAMYLAWC